MNLEIKNEGELAFIALAMELLPVALIQFADRDVTDDGMEVINEIKARIAALDIDGDLRSLDA